MDEASAHANGVPDLPGQVKTKTESMTPTNSSSKKLAARGQSRPHPICTTLESTRDLNADSGDAPLIQESSAKHSRVRRKSQTLSNIFSGSLSPRMLSKRGNSTPHVPQLGITSRFMDSHHGLMRIGPRPDGLRGKKLFKASVNLVMFLLAIKNDSEFRNRILGGVESQPSSDKRMKKNLPPKIALGWEIFQSSLMVFTLFFETYVISFVLSRGEYCHTALCTTFKSRWWVVFLTLAVAADVVVSCFIPYVDKLNGRLVVHNTDISLRYFRGRFILDAVSVVGGALSLQTGNQYFRFLALFRILHIERLAFAPDLLMVKLTGGSKIGSRSFLERWFNLLTAGIIVGHLAACSFFMIAVFEDHSYDSWTNVAGVRDWQAFDQYTTALYWAFATMTTVGYGDVTTSTPVERAFGVFMLFVGAIFFSFLVGKMGALSSEMDEGLQRTRQERRMVEKFIQKHQLNDSLIARIRENQVNSESRLPPRAILSIDDFVMSTFNHVLRRDIIMFIKAKLIDSVPLLCQASTPLQYRLVAVLKKGTFFEKEYVQVFGDHSDTMYFIESGSVAVVDLEGHISQTLTSGSFFGEKALMLDCKHDASVRIKSRVAVLHSLSRKDMDDVINHFPEFRSMLESAVQIRNLDGTTLAHAEGRLRKSIRNGSQTPPYGTTWRQVRRQQNRFDLYYRSALSRSRTLQAAQYTPTPLDLSRVRLPKYLNQVVNLVSRNLHENWAYQRILDGWMYGDVRDNVKKTHSRLVPWNLLTEEEKNWNLETTRDLIKMMHRLGYSIRLPVNDPKLSCFKWEFGTIPLKKHILHSYNHDRGDQTTMDSENESITSWDSSSHHFEDGEHHKEEEEGVHFPNPFNTDDLELPPNLGILVESIASKLHEKWAADRLAEGWKFSTVHDDVKKQHHCLLPFEFLSKSDQNRNFVSILEVFKGIIYMGCEILKPHRSDGMAASFNSSIRTFAQSSLFGQGSSVSKATSSIVTGVHGSDSLSQCYSMKQIVQSINERLLVLENAICDKNARGFGYSGTAQGMQKRNPSSAPVSIHSSTAHHVHHTRGTMPELRHHRPHQRKGNTGHGAVNSHSPHNQQHPRHWHQTHSSTAGFVEHHGGDHDEKAPTRGNNKVIPESSEQGSIVQGHFNRSNQSIGLHLGN